MKPPSLESPSNTSRLRFGTQINFGHAVFYVNAAHTQWLQTFYPSQAIQSMILATTHGMQSVGSVLPLFVLEQPDDSGVSGMPEFNIHKFNLLYHKFRWSKI
jgi:hypothetical protein